MVQLRDGKHMVRRRYGTGKEYLEKLLEILLDLFLTCIQLTQFDTRMIYKKLAPLKQEKSHCMRNWLKLISKK